MSRTLKIDDQYEKFYRLEKKLKTDLIDTITSFTEFLISSTVFAHLQKLQIIDKNNEIVSSLQNLKVSKIQNTSNDDDKISMMDTNSDIIINKLLDKINSINNSTNCNKIKSERIFNFKICNVSEFFSSNLKLFSNQTYLNDMSWRIRTQKYREKSKIGLSFYLECNNNLKITNWSCNAKVELRLINQNLNSENLVRSFEHKFDRTAPTFGYKFFISWTDIFESEKGFIKDDSILLEAYIKLI